MNSTIAQALFFDAHARGIPSTYGWFFDPAFLNALAAVDPSGSTSSRILRGDALVHMLCGRIAAVSNEKNAQSSTYNYDMELYRTIIWDLADAFTSQWHTVDLEEFPLLLARGRIHCIVLPTMPTGIRDEIDGRLRGTTGYLGSVTLDLGNPIQLQLFINQLVDDAFVKNGAVYLERNWEGIDDTLFEGASTFEPGGEKRLPPIEFAAQRPPIPTVPSSDRGKETLERYRGKRIATIEQRVLQAVAEWRDPDSNSFAFSSSAPENAVLEANLPEAKFVQYLLNPDHPVGAGKAKFFREVLGIEANEWRYLAAQFYEGLRRMELSDLKVKIWEDGFGASFNCVLPIAGLNGRVAHVLTNWIMKPGQLPQLSTALPGEKSADAEGEESRPQSIVSGNLEGTKKWEELYRLADEAGNSAAERCVPTPMKVAGYDVEMEGMCGSAWVLVPDARRGFARWVVRTKHGYTSTRGGAKIFALHPSQSVDRAVAYAKAFASVLKLNGIECGFDFMLD